MTEHIIAAIGQVAWPITALVILFVLISELKNGLIRKVLPPGASFSAGEWKITREIESTEEKLESAHVEIKTPPYIDAVSSDTSDDLSPYELVMTSYTGLASAVAELAAKNGGYADQRQVWSNIDILLKKNVISPEVFGAIRSAQQIRNSIRRQGQESVNRENAKSFAKSAYSLQQSIIDLSV